MAFIRTLALSIPFAAYSLAVPSTHQGSGTVVRLDHADFIGVTDGNLTSFLGIPFAKPARRFSLPEPNDAYHGSYSVTTYGPACTQQNSTILPLPEGLDPAASQYMNLFRVLPNTPEAEDCLTLNVVKPANVHPNAKIPVAVSIFGGGFQFGSPMVSPGNPIVAHSIALGEPIIYVSINYRVSAYGFLPGKEVKEAGVGNIGLHDQRQGLRWIHKYIAAFGGDPNKVTIWGVSAGAMAVALQMLTNGGNTEGLFHGAFMQSGAPLLVGDLAVGQKSYDALVADTGCSGAADTLECLKQVPLSTLKPIVDSSPSIFSYQSLDLAWVPRADGVFLEAPPQQLVMQGSVAKVPFVIGSCDDEGTIFSFDNLNVTDVEFDDYTHEVLLGRVPANEVQGITRFYPSDPAQGSPFDTGGLNAITPQYKRLSAIQGDAMFHGPKRFFLEQRSDKQAAWSYLYKETKPLPVIGAAHGTDNNNLYSGRSLADSLVRFVNHLNPNGKSGNQWPRYSTAAPKNFVFGVGSTTVEDDDYRKEAISALNAAKIKYPN